MGFLKFLSKPKKKREFKVGGEGLSTAGMEKPPMPMEMPMQGPEPDVFGPPPTDQQGFDSPQGPPVMAPPMPEGMDEPPAPEPMPTDFSQMEPEQPPPEPMHDIPKTYVPEHEITLPFETEVPIEEPRTEDFQQEFQPEPDNTGDELLIEESNKATRREREHSPGPLFVNVTQYRDVLEKATEINAKLKEAEDTLERLNDIDSSKETEFEKWRKTMEEIQRKLILTERSLFED